MDCSNNSRETVARSVRDLMAARGTTADELAGRIGIDRDEFSRRLQADAPFTVDDLASICLHFSVDLAELFSVQQE